MTKEGSTTTTVNGRMLGFMGGMLLTAGLYILALGAAADESQLLVKVGFGAFLVGGFLTIWGGNLLNKLDEEVKTLRVQALWCPHCGTRLEELKAPTPSGHTHQCPDCQSLHAPYGLSE